MDYGFSFEEIEEIKGAIQYIVIESNIVPRDMDEWMSKITMVLYLRYNRNSLKRSVVERLFSKNEILYNAVRDVIGQFLLEDRSKGKVCNNTVKAIFESLYK